MAESQSNLEAMRHSMAHILATAVQELYPGVKFGVGPVIENGFYYDFDLDATITPEDLPAIEAKMKEIIKAAQPFEHEDKSLEEAEHYFKQRKQPYKVELLHDLKTHGTTVAKDINKKQLGIDNAEKITTVSLYSNGPFTDLCRGGHLENTKQAGVFKLTKVSGAYWRGKAENPQMQRVYGVAFAQKGELNTYLAQQAEAEKRDHRKLGKELDLYATSPLVGSGLPLFTPRGTVLREELNRFSQELREEQGFEKVWVPHIAKSELYKVSGHWQKFADEWLLVKSQETSDDLVMKPMNCPHHQQIYASKPRSYRDLPIMYLETTTIYRDEKAGELLGLSRVRSVTQDDSHIFCTEDQIKEVLTMLVGITKRFYEVIGMDLKVRLSVRDDAEGYLGDAALWDTAEQILREVITDNGFDFYEGIGEAAFYGPKIDFMGTDALGREWQLATPQLDFVQPKRFELEYTNNEGLPVTPVMIHFALLGSIERFLSVYIEHTAGNFPVWLAPEQVRLITVNDSKAVQEKATQMRKHLKVAKIRSVIDNSDESVGKKIRASSVAKVPYTIVVGEKEVEDEHVSPRIRHDLGSGEPKLGFDDFIKHLQDEIKQRSSRSSLV